ncbi:MAG: PTS sugar transporter subunit IIA, partial [Erysipelotrichaceae bacterium]
LDDKDHPIDIFIIIASADNNSHLTALASLSEILISDDLVNELKGLRTVSDIANFFRKEEEK